MLIRQQIIFQHILASYFNEGLENLVRIISCFAAFLSLNLPTTLLRFNWYETAGHD